MVFHHHASHDNRIGTDKTTLHSYGPVYEALFADLKTRTDPQHIMEIGVLSGASVLNLAYEFPNATLHAVDISLEPAYLKDTVDSIHPSVKWYEMDACQASNVSNIPDDVHFNLIIDDGSHQADDIYNAFMLWAPRVVPGGFYVIEDLTQEVMLSIWPSLKNVGEKHGFHFNLHDLRHAQNRWDDILLIAYRGGVPGGSDI